MQENINLKQLEKKVFTSFHQDGIIELCIGLVFLLYGIMMVTENKPFLALCWMPALLVMPAKKLITIPRLGYVKFKSSRKIKISKTLIVLLITGLFVFFIILFSTTNSNLRTFMENYFVYFIGLIVAIPPLIGAVLLEIRRYYVHAFLMFWVFGLEGIVKGSAPYNFLTLGMILVVTGFITLIRFLNKYPIPEKSH